MRPRHKPGSRPPLTIAPHEAPSKNPTAAVTRDFFSSLLEPEGFLGRAAAEIRIEGLDGRFVVSPFGSDVPLVARLLFQIVGRFGAVFEIVHEIPHPQR